MPNNQLTLNVGLLSNAWEINLLARYVDQTREASEVLAPGDTSGVVLSGATTKAYTIVDLSISYDLDDLGRVYMKVDNVFDKQEVVSRRPYGARPSKPQSAYIGYQYSF